MYDDLDKLLKQLRLLGIAAVLERELASAEKHATPIPEWSATIRSFENDN